jgi:hypothetical protein
MKESEKVGRKCTLDEEGKRTAADGESVTQTMRLHPCKLSGLTFCGVYVAHVTYITSSLPCT